MSPRQFMKSVGITIPTRIASSSITRMRRYIVTPHTPQHARPATGGGTPVPPLIAAPSPHIPRRAAPTTRRSQYAPGRLNGTLMASVFRLNTSSIGNSRCTTTTGVARRSYRSRVNVQAASFSVLLRLLWHDRSNETLDGNGKAKDMATMAMGAATQESVAVGKEHPVTDQPVAQAACCGATEQATCCAPSAKASCCGTSAAEGAAPRGGCGCR